MGAVECERAVGISRAARISRVAGYPSQIYTDGARRGLGGAQAVVSGGGVQSGIRLVRASPVPRASLSHLCVLWVIAVAIIRAYRRWGQQ